MFDDEVTNPEVETETVETPEVTAETDDELVADPEEGNLQPADDEDEIEYSGKKYRVHKELKSQFMMQADYTKKTQELAESRRSFEAETSKMRESMQKHLVDIANLVNIDQRLQQFGQIDWSKLETDDPLKAQRLWRQHQELKEQRVTVAAQLQEKVQQEELAKQQETAKQREEADAELRRDIPGWSDDMSTKVAEYAVNNGLKPHEVEQISEARIVKLLHKAMKYDELVAKQKSAKSAATQQPEPTPAPTLSSRRPAPSTDLNRIRDTDEWMKQRNKQIANRR